MNVLSLFDGASMGQYALNTLGVKIDNYFSSEIDNVCLKNNSYNYKNNINLGDVLNINYKSLPNIDLLMGGSPCQGFSFAGKQLNFKDSRSKLFFEFVRALEETSPTYFFLENVFMKKEFQDIISKYLGVSPITINSNVHSAQTRKRLYWTNLNYQESIGSLDLIDILQTHSHIYPCAIRGRYVDIKKTKQFLEVNKNINKSNCLTTVNKDSLLTNIPKGKHLKEKLSKNNFRNFTKIERSRLMGLSDSFFENITENQSVKICGNGWNVDTIKCFFKNIK